MYAWRCSTCVPTQHLADLSFNSALHSDVVNDSFASVRSCRRNLVARLLKLSSVILLLTEDLVEHSDCDTVISRTPLNDCPPETQ